MRARWMLAGLAAYNLLGTHLPSSTLRASVLRAWGARIAPGVRIDPRTTVLGIENLVIGEGTTIGVGCLLDARGGLRLGRRVRVGADTQFISANHEVNSNDFSAAIAPIVVGDGSTIASRVTVLQGVTIGPSAAIGPCSLVRGDIAAGAVADGIPARVLTSPRPSSTI